MKKSEILEYILPEYLACYLINWDAELLTDEEKIEIDNYLATQGIYITGIKEFDNNESASFRWSNDLNNIGGNCLTYYAFSIE